MTNSEYGMTVLDSFQPEDDVITILNRAFSKLHTQLADVTADRDEAWATIERMALDVPEYVCPTHGFDDRDKCTLDMWHGAAS